MGELDRDELEFYCIFCDEAWSPTPDEKERLKSDLKAGWEAYCERGPGNPAGRAKPRTHTRGQRRTRSVHHDRSAARSGSQRSQHGVVDRGAPGDREASFTPERLSTYLTAAGGDRERALQLYTRNTQAERGVLRTAAGARDRAAERSAPPAHPGLRRGLVRQRGRWPRPGWGSSGSPPRRRRSSAPARQPRPGRLVAALSFGFWVSLVGSGGHIDPRGSRATYEMTLWRPALRGAFPTAGP